MNAAAIKNEMPDNYFGFVADVNTILLARAGVSYAEVVRSIHPGSDAPKHAFEGGVSPSDFVSGIIADETFLEIESDHSAADVRGHNMAMAAIAEFVYETPGWHRTSDSTYFSHTEDSTLTIRPVANAGRYGFGVELWEGISSDHDSAITPDMGSPIARFAGYDIDDPIKQAQEHIASAKVFNL
jgi:hypothetical protein